MDDRITMQAGVAASALAPDKLLKSPSGIKGLGEIMYGGLPRGRTTLVRGGPGCDKTSLALEFLVRGATRFGEPGVFVAFEETAGELATNAASLGLDLAALQAEGCRAGAAPRGPIGAGRCPDVRRAEGRPEPWRR
jgi:predicted ATP-dependent serine protease